MFISFKYAIKREILLALRGRGQWLNPLIFFIMVSSLFPLSAVINPASYALLAPSIIWITFLLATILSLEFSFRADFEDGVFEQWVLSPEPLWFLLLTKGFAHWMVHLLPMILVAPIIAYSLHFQPVTILLISLMLGTPALSMVALMIVCLTIGLKNSGMLLSLILLPLVIPILILGIGAAQVLEPQVYFAFLGAILILSSIFCPLGAAFALKTSLS